MLKVQRNIHASWITQPHTHKCEAKLRKGVCVHTHGCGGNTSLRRDLAEPVFNVKQVCSLEQDLQISFG